MRYQYVVADVFSAKPFGGNQLAVVTDARGISSEGMQAITREFNYAETTFVLPADHPGCVRRIRIFTPGTELPFAGHPSVGTACVLVMSGACAEGTLTLQEGIGPVPVVVEARDGGLTGTLSLERQPDLAAAPARADAALLLSLDQEELVDVFCAGAGVNFTFIQVRDRDAVDRARLDPASWERTFAGAWGAQIFVFAGELVNGGELYARMFAPAFGIMEDPATGSAVAALVGAASLKTGAETEFALSIIQGVAMGRRSELYAYAELQSGIVHRMKVRGAASFVAQGEIEVPDEWLMR